MIGRATGMLAAGLALAVAACANDTAIVVEVSWELSSVRAADALRIYVGTPTADEAAFVTNAGTRAIPLADATSPYRYLLRPGDDVDAIGDLQLAAAITEGDGGVQFAPAADLVRFADGEIRTVKLAPVGRRFELGGDAHECVTWSAAGDGALDRAIGAAGDNDCDLRINPDDCQPFNPRITGANLDGDAAICDDCFDADAPMMVGGWRVEPSSVFPGQSEDGFRTANAIPDNVVCTHIDYDCSGGCGADNGGGDQDDSDTDTCGSVKLGAAFLACAPTPSDCDESVPGDTAVFGDPEVCDGADESCDKRPAPHLPCLLPGPNGCTVGQQDCNDARGTFGVCVPTGFPHELDAINCTAMDRIEGCRFTDDPLQCAAGDRERCAVASSVPGCTDERLALPGLPGGTGCDWRVIGGVDHAEWVIGLVSAANSTEPPVATTNLCAPFLVARAVHPNPTPRTVMILGNDPTSSTVIAHFVTFSADDNATCDRVLACTPFAFMP